MTVVRLAVGVKDAKRRSAVGLRPILDSGHAPHRLGSYGEGRG